MRFERRSTSIIHYLDGFWFVSPGGSDACRYLLDTFHFFMQQFGVLLSAEKTEGPVTVLSILGIEIGLNMVFRLPADKLARLISLIDGFVQFAK